MNTPLKRSGLFLATVLCSTTALAELTHDFGTKGYFRIGAGFSDDDSSQAAFQAPGAGAKYRLGNENDTYSEIGFFDTMRLDANGPYVHVVTMPSFYSAQGFKIEFDGLAELYAEAGDFTTALGNPKIWVGRRYYDRHDIHINDFFFLNTLQLFDAGGIRDMDLGFGKLALAMGRKNDDTVKTVYQSRYDARLSDIAVNRNGSIMFWGAYYGSGGDKAYKELDGYALGVMHTQQEFFGGFNKFMVQYGSGLGRGAGLRDLDPAAKQVRTSADADAFKDAKTLRVLNTNVIEMDPNWAVMTSFVYQDSESKKYDGIDQTWISLGARPMWFLHKNFRVPLELGWDYVDNKVNNTKGSLLKATLAAEFALDRGFWARPVLRLFVTYATWSDEFKGAVGGSAHANKTDGFSIGVQAEHWW